VPKPKRWHIQSRSCTGDDRSKVRGVTMMTLGRQSSGGYFWSRICRYRVAWVMTPWKMEARSSTPSRLRRITV
jgi:hypothetical protein